jgi:hypothetical protein
MEMATEAQLLEMIEAFRSAGRLARRLNRRQQQRNENPDDGDHNE